MVNKNKQTKNNNNKNPIETATTFPELLPVSYVAEIFLVG